MYVLGISGYYHDSAAALVQDGQIIAAAQEERFTRIKHDASFPANSIEFCLSKAGIGLSEVQHIGFYEKPLLKFDRLLETYLAYAPKGFSSFRSAIPIWLKQKLFIKDLLRRELAGISGLTKKDFKNLLFSEHHQSHAASAFFPSPFESATVLCLDGVGEWATTSIWSGQGNKLDLNWTIEFPHSIGMLYSAFTYFSGFKVNSGEYKLMGLAPYGSPKFVRVIYDNLIDLQPDGTFHLNMDYFNFAAGLTMTNDRFSNLFGGPPRNPDGPLTQREMDLAASVQSVVEEVVLRLGNTLFRELGRKHLCLAGGVALNCVANGRLADEGPFEKIWIQPAAGDAGGALGCALSIWHQYLDRPRIPTRPDSMNGALLGPKYEALEIRKYLDSVSATYAELVDEDLFSEVAQCLNIGKVVGWFQDQMEFGPRALGNRSILGDPRDSNMQSTLNLKIKYRESFRPFAPSIIREEFSSFFEGNNDSPYMLTVAKIKKEHRNDISGSQLELKGLDQLKLNRSSLPAITHVDFSSRVQSVSYDINPRYYQLLKAFQSLTGCPVLVNTSFNVRGEPIVCTPEDAYRCFMMTEMDALVIGNFVLYKEKQLKETGLEPIV